MIAARNPERALVVGYALPADRAALRALLLLDDTLGGILRTTRDPVVGQMRLTWWHNALLELDHGAVPAEPVLQALAEYVLRRGLTGEGLAILVEGWESLADAETLDDAAMLNFASRRGGHLFEIAAVVLGAGPDNRVVSAGTGWALADLARHHSDSAVQQRAVALAGPILAEALRGRWSRRLRPLGALAHLAKLDLRVALDRPLPIGAPHRVARIFWHRIAGH